MNFAGSTALPMRISVTSTSPPGPKSHESVNRFNTDAGHVAPVVVSSSLRLAMAPVVGATLAVNVADGSTRAVTESSWNSVISRPDSP
ncbi:hypothetical protein D3C86_1764490 [compost metagenome]